MRGGVASSAGCKSLETASVRSKRWRGGVEWCTARSTSLLKHPTSHTHPPPPASPDRLSISTYEHHLLATAPPPHTHQSPHHSSLHPPPLPPSSTHQSHKPPSNPTYKHRRLYATNPLTSTTPLTYFMSAMIQPAGSKHEPPSTPTHLRAPRPLRHKPQPSYVHNTSHVRSRAR